MNYFKRSYTLLLLIFLFISTASVAQFYNTDVEAKINLEDNNEFLKISSLANNKTEISQSIRYVLSVIKTSPNDGNRSKNDQSGRIVLQPTETKELSTTTINSNKTDRIVILLLLYDTGDNIIGKDRILLNSGQEDEDKPISDGVQEENIETKTSSEDVQNKGEDGVFLLKGIVVEDTKTKPGRDFFKLFSSKYTSEKINGEKTITVTEIFALGRNTKIEIRAEDEIIFQFFVRPKKEFLEEMSIYAINFTQRFFKRLRANKDQIRRY